MTHADFLRKIFGSICVLAWVFWPGAHLRAWAEGIEGAESRLSNAYNEYYQAVKSGRVKTKEDAVRIQKELVDPADAEVTKTIADNEQAAIKKHIGRALTPEEMRAAKPPEEKFSEADIPSVMKVIEEENKTFQSASKSNASSDESEDFLAGPGLDPKVSKDMRSGSGKNDVKIDGSGFDKVLVFPGSKPAAKKP